MAGHEHKHVRLGQKGFCECAGLVESLLQRLGSLQGSVALSAHFIARGTLSQRHAHALTQGLKGSGRVSQKRKRKRSRTHNTQRSLPNSNSTKPHLVRGVQFAHMGNKCAFLHLQVMISRIFTKPWNSGPFYKIFFSLTSRVTLSCRAP